LGKRDIGAVYLGPNALSLIGAAGKVPGPYIEARGSDLETRRRT